MNLVLRVCFILIGGVEFLSEGKCNYICNILVVSKVGLL